MGHNFGTFPLELIKKHYSVIYADPPWQYDTKQALQPKSILNGELNTHYPTMSTEEIKALPVRGICEKDCLLFLWVVSPMLPDGLEVMKAWGFKYSTIGFVWDKINPNVGSYTMSQCEICLIGRRGKIPTPREDTNTRQFLRELKKGHSAKPEEFRRRIHGMFPECWKMELFSRDIFEEWDVWGNETK